MRNFRSIASVAGALILGACGGGKRDRPAEESHDRMLGELSLVAKQTGDNGYLSDRKAIKGRAAIAAFDSSTPPDERFEVLMHLGLAELNLGNERAAITAFESAEKFASSVGVTPQMADKCRYFLGVSFLRLGETENCCREPNAESCLFPIRAGGLHANREGSEGAIGYLMKVIASPTADPHDQLDAVWLLNLAHMTLGQFPEGVPERLRLQHLDRFQGNPSGFPKFPNISAKLGLNTYGLSGGAVFDDFDGDGWPDLAVSIWDPRTDVQFFKNEEGRSFSNRSGDANLTGISGGLNLRHADYDDDGDLDLLVLRGAWLNVNGQHPNSLLRNDGPDANGVPRFTDVTFTSGLGEVHYPTQTAEWADYDLDGDLDLFVGNETDTEFRAPCQLFRNEGPDAEGHVQFTDVARSAGVENFRFTKGVSWGDYDGDRDPDLYVSNLRVENRFYRNNGDGTFTDVAPELGMTGPVHSFPVWFWDFDNDGALDLFVSYYRESGPLYLTFYQGRRLTDETVAALYKGDGRGGFRNVVRETFLDVAMLPMGSNFGDLDNNGFPDIYLGTGDPNYGSVVPNQLLINHDGARFEDVSIPAGMGHLQKGHAVSVVDCDQDGDLDVFEQMGGALPGDPYYDALYENPGFPGTHWLAVRLKGVRSNSFGVGCRIRAVIDGGNGVERSVYAHINSGGSFGANPLTAHLGLGGATTVKRLEIFWPVTGETQVLEKIPAGRRIVVTEGEAGWED